MVGQWTPRHEAVAQFVAALPALPDLPLGEPPLHPRTARALALEFGRGWSRRNLAKRGATLAGQAQTVAVIAPGNLFVGAWQAALAPWMAGHTVRVRGSRRDGGAVGWMLQQLRPFVGAEPLPDQVAIDHGDDHAWRQFLNADVAAVWGSDATVATVHALAARLGCAPQFDDHGATRAVAVAQIGGATAHQLDRIMRGLARDALHGDGRGCLALGAVVWLGANASDLNNLHDRLHQALRKTALALPAGNTEVPFIQNLEMQGESLQLAASLAPDVHCARRRDGWLATAPLAVLGGLWPGPARRCVLATAAADVVEVEAALAPFVGSTSGLAVAADAATRSRLARTLRARWVCRPGQLQRAPCGV